MPIIGEAHINIRALDKNFRKDIEKAVKGIRDVGIQLKVDADISDAQSKIDDLRRASGSAAIEINVRADTQKLEESLKKATTKIRPVKIAVSANSTEFTKSVRELNDKVKNMKVKVPVFAAPVYFKRDIDTFIRNMKLNPVKIPVVIDASQAQKSLDEIEKQTQSTIPLTLDPAEALKTAQETSTVIENMAPEMTATADADTGKAEAQISFLTRARKVKVVMDMEKSAVNSFRGLVEALAGVVPVQQVSDAIENVLSNFSALAVGTGVTVSALSALTTVGVAAAGSILTISSDIGNLVGLLALAPAGFTAMYIATKTLGKAFEGFSAAVKKGGPDIEALVPAARGAARAMHEVVKVMNTEIKNSFWEQAGDSMITFAGTVMPQFSTAMQATATNFGNAFDEMLTSLINFGEESNEAGTYLENFLRGITTGLGYISDAIHPVTDAFITLGEVGAQYFPEMGKAVRNAAEDFNDFIQTAGKAGDINRWIEEGATALKNLGSVIGSTVAIFGNLAEAARRAGFGGLQALADGLRDIADASGEALAMERLETIFRGAGEGATELFRGLKLIGDTLMESSEGLSNFLDIAGQIGRVTFENLDALLNADGFGEGVTRALEGFRNGLDAATPGFEALGSVIGNLGQIAGTLFETMAPGFNNLMITIDKVVAGIRDGFIAAMPVVNEFVDMFMQLIRGPLVIAATAVGKLLELFAMLPTPIQNTAIAVVALNRALALLGIAGGAIGVLGGKMDTLGGKAAGSSGLVSKLGTALGVVAGIGAGAGAATSKAADGTGKIADSADRATGRLGGLGAALGGLAGGLIGVGDGGKKASTGIGNAGESAGRAGGRMAGVLGAVTGLARGYLPLFLAITAVTSAFKVYDETTGSTAEKTSALGTAMQQYGVSSAEAATITSDLISSHKGFAESVLDLIPGVEGLHDNTTLAARGFENLGWSVEDISSAINSSGGEWTGYRQKIEDLIGETGMFETVTREASQAVLGNASAAGMTGEQLRAMRDAYDDANRGVEEHVQAQIRVQEAAKKAANFNREVAESVSRIGPEVAAAAAGFDVLGDSTSTVDQKMSAFQSTIAYVNSEFGKGTPGIMSDTQAKMANAQANADLGTSLESVATNFGSLGGAVISTKGIFNETTAEGRNFYASMQEIAVGIQEVGVAAYDTALKNGDSISVASQKAVDAMQPMTDQVVTMLQNMGVTGEEEINTVLSALGLLPEEVKMAFNAEGNAADKARETKLIVEGLVAGNYDMAIGAVNEQAMSVIAESVGAGDDFAAGNYEAVFKALAEEYGVTEAVKLLEGTAGQDYEAIMKMYADDYASDEIDAVLEKGGHLDGKSFEAKIGAINGLGPEVETALDQLARVDGTDVEAEMKAINDIPDEAQKALGELLGVDGMNAEAVLNAIDNLSPEVRTAMGLTEAADGKQATIHLDALDDATPQVVGAIEQAVGFDGTKATATLEALDNLSPKARDALAEVLGISSSEGYALLGAIDNLSPAAQAALGDVAQVGNASGEARLSAINDASPAIEMALSDIGSLDGLSAEARLDAVNNASQRSREALADILGINSAEGTALLSAIDNLGPTSQIALENLLAVDGTQATGTLVAIDQTRTAVSSAQATMGSLENVTRMLDATNSTAGAREQAQASMNSLQDVTRDLRANNVTPGTKAEAQATMDSLQDVMRDLEANNATPAVKAAAQATMDSLQDVMRKLDADDRTAGPVGNATRAMEGVPSVRPSIDVQSNAPQKAEEARGVLGSIKDVFVNIFTRRSDANAEGGIYTGQGQIAYAQGGIQKAEAFANGGVKLPKNISSFASGSENHVAQISKGKWPVRIWSEPETGGEAYIPLGLNKRPRSLDILKQVAEMFGFSIVKKFADGGILKELSTSKTGHFADGGFNGAPKNISGYITGRNNRVETAQSSAGNVIYSPTMNVYPSAQLDEEQVAEGVSRDLFWKIINH